MPRLVIPLVGGVLARAARRPVATCRGWRGERDARDAGVGTIIWADVIRGRPCPATPHSGEAADLRAGEAAAVGRRGVLVERHALVAVARGQRRVDAVGVRAGARPPWPIRSGVSSSAFSASIAASHSAPSAARVASTTTVLRRAYLSISSKRTSTSCSCGTFRSGLPLEKMRPSFLAPVIPKSACEASPIPLTAQPRTATSTGSVVGLQPLLDLGDDGVHVELQAAAGRAGDQHRAALAQLERLEDLPGDLDLLLGVEGARARSGSCRRCRRPAACPSPTERFSEPDHLVPASVMPRCSGYGMRSESSRFEAIVFGTFVDLIDTLKSSKSSRSISATNSTAAVTSASTGF